MAVPVSVPNRTAAGLWKIAQWIGVAATLVLLAGLVLRPEPSLDILWNVLIPVVPASLLISPAIWRNVCPLATLNTVSNRAGGQGTLTRDWLPAAGLVGIVLLVVMVPARRFLFNLDGTVLAITVAAVAVLAVAMGAFFQLKAGFCNAICPVLPVERLYGQYPLLKVGNPRCVPCTHCTAAGCIDLGPSRSIGKTLGTAFQTRAWLTTGYGIFAATFPGFVIGYYTTQDGPLSTAGAVYLNVAIWMVGSYLVTALIVSLFKLSATRTFLLLAALAAGLYYWYAADTITTAFAIEGIATTAIRVVGIGLALIWLWRALPQSGPRPGPAAA